jgi:hypothetical protein
MDRCFTTSTPTTKTDTSLANRQRLDIGETHEGRAVLCYFSFRREIFDYIGPGDELVEAPFHRLIAEQRLMTYQCRCHGGELPDPLEIASGATADRRDYRVTCERFADAVGFQTGWTVRSGGKQLLAPYREVGVTLEELGGGRYQRIGHIQSLMADGVLGPDLRFVGAGDPAAG